jgi:hypothetical protein
MAFKCADSLPLIQADELALLRPRTSRRGCVMVPRRHFDDSTESDDEGDDEDDEDEETRQVDPEMDIDH